MLAPGMSFTATGRADVTAGAGTVPDHFSGGVGFMADGSLAIDTDAPAGTLYVSGIRRSSAGAIYGTTVTNVADTYPNGMRVSPTGQLVYAQSDPASFNNGNPITAAGAFATN